MPVPRSAHFGVSFARRMHSFGDVQPVFDTGLHSSCGGVMHEPALQYCPAPHEPHEPPQPSEPQILPTQLGAHGGLHVPAWHV